MIPWVANLKIKKVNPNLKQKKRSRRKKNNPIKNSHLKVISGPEAKEWKPPLLALLRCCASVKLDTCLMKAKHASLAKKQVYIFSKSGELHSEAIISRLLWECWENAASHVVTRPHSLQRGWWWGWGTKFRSLWLMDENFHFPITTRVFFCRNCPRYFI